MSSRKRSYSTVGGTPKAMRMVGGRPLTYTPAAPVVGSSRYRQAPLASRGFFGSQTRLARQMQGILEKKVVDTAAASYVVDTTGSITLINGVAQGSDYTNRIGRKWTMTAVQLTGVLGPNASADNATGTHAKVLIIYDSQPNGALPSMSDIFTASTSDAFMNLNNRDRFKVIAVHDCALGPFDNTTTVALADNSTQLVNVYKSVQLQVINDGTTAAIGDIQTGALLLVTIGNNGASTGYTFRGAVRIRFVDA